MLRTELADSLCVVPLLEPAPSEEGGFRVFPLLPSVCCLGKSDVQRTSTSLTDRRDEEVAMLCSVCVLLLFVLCVLSTCCATWRKILPLPAHGPGAGPGQSAGCLAL